VLEIGLGLRLGLLFGLGFCELPHTYLLYVLQIRSPHLTRGQLLNSTT